MTSFVFRVRNLPAALYKALGGFATNGINMTKLESYMLEGEFLATQFYAEVDGHPEDINLKRASRGTRVLLAGDADPRRLPGRPVPRKVDGSRRVAERRLQRVAEIRSIASVGRSRLIRLASSSIRRRR